MSASLSSAWMPAALLLVPRLAWACPACARDNASGTAALAIGLMILAPFLLATWVIRAVIRGERERR